MRIYKTGISRAIYSGIAFGLGDAISYFIPHLLLRDRNHHLWLPAHLFRPRSRQSPSLRHLQQYDDAIFRALTLFLHHNSNGNASATVANLPLDSHEKLGTRRLATPFPTRFSDLSFTYPSRNQKTLSSIALTIAPGTSTALVGPLPRFRKIDSGLHPTRPLSTRYSSPSPSSPSLILLNSN